MNFLFTFGPTWCRSSPKVYPDDQEWPIFETTESFLTIFDSSSPKALFQHNLQQSLTIDNFTKFSRIGLVSWLLCTRVTSKIDFLKILLDSLSLSNYGNVEPNRLRFQSRYWSLKFVRKNKKNMIKVWNAKISIFHQNGAVNVSDYHHV